MNTECERLKIFLKKRKYHRFQAKEILFSLLLVLCTFALIHLVIQIYQGKNKLQIFYVRQPNGLSEPVTIDVKTETNVEFCLNNEQIVLDDISEIRDESGKYVKNFLPDDSVIVHGKGELGYDENVLLPQHHMVAVLMNSKVKQTDSLQRSEEETDSKSGQSVPKTESQGLTIDFSSLPMAKILGLFQETPRESIPQLNYPVWRDDIGVFDIGKSFKRSRNRYESYVSGPTVLYVSSYLFYNRRLPRVIIAHSGGNSNYDDDARLALERYLSNQNEQIQKRFFKDNGVTVRVYWNDKTTHLEHLELQLYANPTFFSGNGGNGK